jgi:hypothetical protein
MNFHCTVCIISAAIVSVTTAQAAKITFAIHDPVPVDASSMPPEADNSGPRDIDVFLSDEIKPGDDITVINDFDHQLQKDDAKWGMHGQALLHLNSVGGNYEAALHLMRYLIQEGIGTRVDKRDFCQSACPRALSCFLRGRAGSLPWTLKSIEQ